MFKLTPGPFALTLASAVAWSALALGQAPSPPKDDALDSLLEKLDDKAKPAASKASADEKSDARKPADDLAPKDQALDSLLEKLGETKDKPSPDDRPKGPGHGSDDEPMPMPKPDQAKPDGVEGKDKPLDQHLEELTGRKPKKKDKGGDGNSPLSKVIKEMREVEQRLGKPDTGAETRKRQAEIVRELDQVLEKIRQAQAESQGKKQLKLTMQPGQKQPSKPGETPGSMGGNAPHAKPLDPKKPRPLAGSKDVWGDLPPALREEMDNVFKEEGLPSREELIRRYYLSLSKKILNRED